MLGSCAKR